MPATPNRSVIDTCTPHLASTAWTSALQLRRRPDQLRAMADQLAQFPGRRWRDPRLGQSTHPQQVRQISGVAFIVLHPPILEHLHPQRVRQMHAGALRKASTAQYQP